MSLNRASHRGHWQRMRLRPAATRSLRSESAAGGAGTWPRARARAESDSEAVPRCRPPGGEAPANGRPRAAPGQLSYYRGRLLVVVVAVLLVPGQAGMPTATLAADNRPRVNRRLLRPHRPSQCHSGLPRGLPEAPCTLAGPRLRLKMLRGSALSPPSSFQGLPGSRTWTALS